MLITMVSDDDLPVKEEELIKVENKTVFALLYTYIDTIFFIVYVMFLLS